MTQDTEDVVARVNRRIDLLEQGDPRAATWVADFREILAERQSLSDRIDVLTRALEFLLKNVNAASLVRNQLGIEARAKARAALHQEGIATVSGRNPATHSGDI